MEITNSTIQFEIVAFLGAAVLIAIGVHDGDLATTGIGILGGFLGAGATVKAAQKGGINPDDFEILKAAKTVNNTGVTVSNQADSEQEDPDAEETEENTEKPAEETEEAPKTDETETVNNDSDSGTGSTIETPAGEDTESTTPAVNLDQNMVTVTLTKEQAAAVNTILNASDDQKAE